MKKKHPRQRSRVGVSKPSDPVELVDRHEIRALVRAIAPAAYTEFMTGGGDWVDYTDAAESVVTFAEAIYRVLAKRDTVGVTGG